MKRKHVYLTDDLEQAREAISAARRAGVLDDDIVLIARNDIEMEVLPENRRSADTDFQPAAVKGAMTGGSVGIVAGLVAMVIPPLGVTVAGAAAIAALGAVTGTWASSLIGSALPDPIRRRFDDEIQAGRILVVVDIPDESLALVDAEVQRTGASQLPFEEPSAMT
ncbi:hypothetical protein [Arenimonas composti]|uniref:DUF1269 domain-containing protein n=1 Tax=Arenimonas composti TR7-09 = DSM 18010 TaxID=1121013 RepID=A0A091BBY0_9GAMM|nr:hypothetical protein [Arenimonas composti]KFN50173.1 hypothetical protein P873_08010 [Arenimonas composti TR7-09 = DSM 18010]